MGNVSTNTELLREGADFLRVHRLRVIRTDLTAQDISPPWISVSAALLGHKFGNSTPDYYPFLPKRISPAELAVRIVRRAGMYTRFVRSGLSVATLDEGQNMPLCAREDMVVVRAIQVIRALSPDIITNES